jgi:hypothetical protein
MKAFLNLLSLQVLISLPIAAQEKSEALTNDSLTKELGRVKKEIADIKNLKVSGWIQAQFQYAESKGVANYEGGNFAANSDKRFMIRRGRVKFTYNAKNSQYVMQLNGTERGLNLPRSMGW